MSCGVGCRQGLDLVMLWLWYRPEATALIQPLAWDLPYAVGMVLKRPKKYVNFWIVFATYEPASLDSIGFWFVRELHTETFCRAMITRKRWCPQLLTWEDIISCGEVPCTRREHVNKTLNYKTGISFYRAVNNSNYGWRALRLLARRSPHFFQPTNQQFKSLPEYLENMVIKLAKELPVSNIGQFFHPLVGIIFLF